MSTLFSILAQPLAPDIVWFALLLLVVLAWMHRLDALRNHVAAGPHTSHHLRDIGHKLRELISHKHP